MPTAATSAAPSLTQRLGLILAGLRRDLAIGAARDRALAALVLLLWNRFSRTAARFAAIAARYRAGTLRPPPTRRRRMNAAPPPRDPLPRQSGWLVRRLPECAAHGEYLRLLLAEPEMLEMIEAAPQLRRLLRPLWRMLRADPVPQVLRPPPAAPAQPPAQSLSRGAHRSRQAPPPPPASGAPTARPHRPPAFRPLSRA